MRALRYDLYVEGQLHSSYKTPLQAIRKQNEFEREGWSVKVVAVYATIAGEMAVVR
jgi:hypothetical protein